ncbi:regulator [Arthrobacter sp. MYb227]|nr:regulator [Arthrobacter sp. MYb227]
MVRTIVGLYIRELGDWISTAHLVSLMDTLGFSAQVTRTALSRLKKKGILEPQLLQGSSGFGLTPPGKHMLARGDRRIFNPRSMSDTDQWCLLSYSIPESQRERRHQLRRHLSGIGGGLVSPGLWIFPAYLRDEVWEILQALELHDHATVFIASAPETTGSPLDVASTWWSLDTLADLHNSFIRLNNVVEQPAAPTLAQSFVLYIGAVDSWRQIPYLDPGLPSYFLPTSWPGHHSAELFLRIQASHAEAALAFVRSAS